MKVRYYCFQSCKAKTSDFNESIQVYANESKRYELIKETKNYVFLKLYGQVIAVKTETFLDNFKVTRI